MSQQNAQCQGENGNAKGTLDFLGYWQANLNTLSWSQEEAERLLLKVVEQQKLTREDAKRVMEESLSQIKKNQDQLLKLIKEGVEDSLTTFGIPTQAQISELSKKIDELTGKLENR